MEFTKESMLPFMISQYDVLNEKKERSWIFEFKNQSAEPWSPIVFNKAWANIRSKTGLKEKIHDEVLLVTAEDGDHVGLALEIQSVQHITKYCYHDSSACVPHVWKRSVAVTRDALPEELPIVVVSSITETHPVTLEYEPTDWELSQKYYILQKKFTYENKDVRYVLSMKRTSTEPTTNMSDSGVTSSPMTYEMSMECKDCANDASKTLEYIVSMMQCILDESVAITKQHQQVVIDGYTALIKTKMIEGRRREDNGTFFFAPKPVTMEKMHIVDPSLGYGIMSVQSGYTVTEKADGERYLMYVHSDGYAYLINNTLDVKATGVKVLSSKMTSTLIDGEYITSDKRNDSNDCDLFMAFDIYFLNGESVMDLPLIEEAQDKPSRYKKLADLIDNDMWETSDDSKLDIDYKKHIAADGPSMFDACRSILTGASKFPYEIDGLIFTPKYLPVFGYYPKKPVKITENVKWDRVLKWKPSDQNTIDFLIEIDPLKRAHPVTKEPYAAIKLYTGYNATQWEQISVMEGLRIRYDKEYANTIRNVGEVYKAKLFSPISYYEKGVEEAHVPYTGNLLLAKNGDIINNRVIVEFAYELDPKVPVSRRWIPLRVREDKTRIFQRTGKLSKTANDLSVATSIWRSIHNPVTMSMITGVNNATQSDIPDELEERLLGVDDTYYAREVPRQHMLSVHMLNFHNQGIKKMLYNRSKSRDALLELACGMAGDLPRWRDAHYRFILGIDLVRDNIVHPREGSYARVQKQKRAVMMNVGGVDKPMYPDMVFVIGDCARPIHDGSAAHDIDEESKKILRLVYRKEHVPQAPYLRFVAGKASRGFDVVSCQFAVHYFFKDEDSLTGFLSNVATNLKKNGIFIATFMDGDRVQALLENSPNHIAEGRKLDGTVVAWAIIKRYTDMTAKFGKQVDVYLENTNRLISEYIVNLDNLVEYANAFDLDLVETNLFSQTFAELKAHIPADVSSRTCLDTDIIELDKDEVQKQFSFLNRWVIFKKR